MTWINIISTLIVIAYAIFSLARASKLKKLMNALIELDKRHAKHLNNILDYQLIMFGCIEKSDLYGVAIAYEYINNELRYVNDILEKKADLIKK